MLTGLQLRTAGVLLALAGAFAAGAHWQGGRDATKAARVAAVQAQRDAVAAATFARAVQERDDAERAAAAANRRIYADLEPKLAAAAADARHLARLLHDALAAGPRGGAAEAPADQPGASGPTGEPSGTGTIAGPIERDFAEYDVTCQRDALRLEALQAEVRGQM